VDGRGAGGGFESNMLDGRRTELRWKRGGGLEPMRGVLDRFADGRRGLVGVLVGVGTTGEE
jgi:hypothetical protein